MNDFLKKTHMRNLVSVLTARERYFNKARKIYYVNICVVLFPVVVAIITYIAPLYRRFSFLDADRDYIVGIITIISMLVGYYIQFRISKYLEVSNMLREQYDCMLYDLERNPLSYDYSVVDEALDLLDDSEEYKIETISKDAIKLKRDWETYTTERPTKYEAWYGEVFSSDRRLNVLCSQMDNIIYTYYLYKYLLIFLIVIIAALVFGIYMMLLFSGDLFDSILIFLSLTGFIQMLIDHLNKTLEQISGKEDIITYVENNVDEIKCKLQESDMLLREIEDVLIRSRDDSLFVWKVVRDLLLYDKKKENKYYKRLDAIKLLYFGEDASMPEKAEEIDVPSYTDVSLDGFTNMQEIHNRLFDILCDMDDCLKGDYVLDGGTLIGTIRNQKENKPGDFLFWDDDIDIAVKYEDLDKIKNKLISELCNPEDSTKHKYEYQDYDSDKFYSPRLSNFRVREKNDFGVLYEKDSELFEKYLYRGLFIDVYAYCPILVNVTIDSLWRKFVIHPMNKSLKKIETKWKSKSGKAKISIENKFENKKKKYRKCVDWYTKHAHNTQFYTYVPNYIDNYKKPGPYIPSEALYGEKNTALFHGREFPVPTNPDVVLEKVYGKGWEASPFRSKKELLKICADLGNTGKWFSHHRFSSTVLKHYMYFDNKADKA